MIRKLWDKLMYRLFHDDCDICHGRRGGHRGAERRYQGHVMCELCLVDTFRSINGLDPIQR